MFCHRFVKDIFCLLNSNTILLPQIKRSSIKTIAMYTSILTIENMELIGVVCLVCINIIALYEVAVASAASEQECNPNSCQRNGYNFAQYISIYNNETYPYNIPPDKISQIKINPLHGRCTSSDTTFADHRNPQ